MSRENDTHDQLSETLLQSQNRELGIVGSHCTFAGLSGRIHLILFQMYPKSQVYSVTCL